MNMSNKPGQPLASLTIPQPAPSCFLPLLVFFMTLIVLFGCDKDEMNEPPIIEVKDIQTVVIGKTVTLDGSATKDPEGQSLTYRWEIKTKPVSSAAVLSNATAVTTEFTADKPGTYIIVLTVTDADGKSATKEITITINVPGQAPIANAGQSATVSIGNKVILDGSKSNDPDGDRLTYKWDLKSKPATSKATIVGSDRVLGEFTPDVIGDYLLTLTVSDGNWPAVSADVKVTAIVPAIREITGKWTVADGTGGGNEYTPRNHIYTFDVATNNQPVSLTLTSPDIDAGFYMYDPNGNVIDGYGSGFGRNQTEDKIVNAGKYTVMVRSGKRYDIGAYVLRGRGLGSDFTRVPALREKAIDVTFGPEGGGGDGPRISARNHYYTFDVTADNSFIDINLQSPETRVWLNLYSPNGSLVRNTYLSTPAYLIEKLNKGTYSLWLGSGERDAMGKYSLDIFGQVQNLKQYVFESAIVSDEYRGKNAATTYTLTVTENNTVIDVSLRSPEGGGDIRLYDPNGTQIANTYANNYEYLVRNTNKGQYKIVVRPNGSTSGLGKYTLSVYGKFTDLKKQ
ncbi:PKD domain-containing protein [Larkinella arboricola]